MSRFMSLSQSSQMSTLIEEELKATGIPFIKKIPDRSSWYNGKPEGRLGYWLFTREEMSWRARITPTRAGDIPYEVMTEFCDTWHATDELLVLDVTLTPTDSLVTGLQIFSIECLTAFADLIRSLEPPKNASTETPVETVAAPTESKPPLYQRLVHALAGELGLIESHPEVDRAILCAHMFNVQLRDSSFPDPAERAWILAKLEEIKAKFPEASRIIGLDETIALFRA